MLQISQDTPWRSELRLQIEPQSKTSKSIMVLDFEDTYDGTDFDNYILNQIAPQKANDYRAHVHGNIQNFITMENLLSDRILWIKGITQQHNSRWQELFSQWKSSIGQLVLELTHNQERNLVKLGKNKSHLYDLDFITSEDNRVFVSMLCREMSENATHQRYLTSLLVHMCGMDAEVSSACLEESDFLKEDPLEIITKVYNKHFFGGFRGSSSNKMIEHPFYHIKNDNRSALEKRVRKAQVEVFFPIIEDIRMDFINLHTDTLRRIMPSSDRFGKAVHSVYDMDINMVVSCIETNRNRDKDAKIIYYSEEFKSIRKFRDIRNRLAHAEVLNLSEVQIMIQWNRKIS